MQIYVEYLYNIKMVVTEIRELNLHIKTDYIRLQGP